MRSRICNVLCTLAVVVAAAGCQGGNGRVANERPLADTVGFAQYGWQMDAIARQINETFGSTIDSLLAASGMKEEEAWKAAISPHDDYAYASYLYPAALRNIKAGTVILFGVAHKARLLHLEDQIIFEAYEQWKGPYGPVKVSSLREEIIGLMPEQSFQVNDSMHRMEHSLEALVPFLQYKDRDVEIVPILVPYMPFEKMQSIAMPLADAIRQAADQRGWKWGEDFALVISNDAVHYGDEDWGGKDFARFGTDSAGYAAAIQHEREVIAAITGELKPGNIERFCNFTVQEEDYHEYKWTWCGRYSVPFGLLTAYHLNHLADSGPLTGCFIGHATSIDHPKLEVEPLGMGVTAPANMRHWVGYAAIGYE